MLLLTPLTSPCSPSLSSGSTPLLLNEARSTNIIFFIVIVGPTFLTELVVVRVRLHLTVETPIELLPMIAVFTLFTEKLVIPSSIGASTTENEQFSLRM